MAQSMTGFATRTITIEQDKGAPLNVTITLKSLNARFFETHCRLPSNVLNLEVDIIRLLKSKLIRGNIYVTINLKNPNAFITAVTPAHSTIEGYLNAVHAIQDKYDLPGEFNITALTRLPNTLLLEEATMSDHSKNELLAEVAATADALLADRKREGAELQHDLRLRVAAMKEYLAAITEMAAQLLAEHKEKTVKKIDEFAENIADEALRESQKQYLYVQLDKMDIHEELNRFSGHLGQLEALLANDKQEKGKALDFTLQECNREINTIAAKSVGLTINATAIATKIEIEKAREQAQNLL